MKKRNEYKSETTVKPNDLDGRYGSPHDDSTPGINTPGIELPAFNPPVPNRAWTAMRLGMDIDEVTED